MEKWTSKWWLPIFSPLILSMPGVVIVGLGYYLMWRGWPPSAVRLLFTPYVVCGITVVVIATPFLYLLTDHGKKKVWEPYGEQIKHWWII